MQHQQHLFNLPLELLLLVAEGLDAATLSTFLSTSDVATATLFAAAPSLITRNPTLLHHAAAKNYSHLLPQLLRHIPITTLDPRSFTALYRAAESGSLDTLNLLLHSGAQAQPRAVRGVFLELPLAVAARNGHLSVVKALLSHPSTTPASRWSALVSASSGGHLDVVTLLMRQRGEPRSVLTTSLCAASAGGHFNVITHLLSHTAVEAHLPDSEGSTPLHHAAKNGRVEVVRMLLGIGRVRRWIDAQDCYGWTALHWAKNTGGKAVADVLVAGGADVEVCNDDGLMAGGESEEVSCGWEARSGLWTGMGVGMVAV